MSCKGYGTRDARRDRASHARFWYVAYTSVIGDFDSISTMRFPLALSLVTASVLVVVTVAQQPRRQFDVLLVNGRIVDGTGAPWFRGDVGMVSDRISAIGSLSDAAAATK